MFIDLDEKEIFRSDLSKVDPSKIISLDQKFMKPLLAAKSASGTRIQETFWNKTQFILKNLHFPKIHESYGFSKPSHLQTFLDQMLNFRRTGHFVRLTEAERLISLIKCQIFGPIPALRLEAIVARLCCGDTIPRSQSVLDLANLDQILQNEFQVELFVIWLRLRGGHLKRLMSLVFSPDAAAKRSLISLFGKLKGVDWVSADLKASSPHLEILISKATQVISKN